MTEGSIFRHIIVFSLPLFFGNLFQQLYGFVDSWVVGNYVSNEAFSAFGGVAQVLNMLIGLFMGITSGTEVVIAAYFGSKDTEKVSKAVHTALIMNLWLAAFIAIVGTAIIPWALRLMKAPEEIRPYASVYLSVYFGGAIGLTTYNVGTGILRAVGDSIRPFCYLAVASVLNVVLDIVFVAIFHWGIAGVAWATVISQSISALLVVARLVRTESCIKIEPAKLRLDCSIQKQILGIGIPAGLQTAITAASNIFLNSYIYFHGVNCMSGWAAYDKLINFMHLPILSVSYAITSCVGQNYGSGKMDRVKECVQKSVCIGTIFSFAIMVVYEMFASELIGMFRSEPEVMDYGVLFLRSIAPFYIFAGLATLYSSASRGLGNSLMPMLVTMCGYVVFRQVFMLFATHVLKNNSIVVLIIAYDISWVFCTIIQRYIYTWQFAKRSGKT